MAQRFEQFYKVRRNDNLGDPNWHDRRWQDIDLRMHARELDAGKIDEAVDTLQALGLARLNDTITPLVESAITRLREVGAVFSGSSHSAAIIDEDPGKEFIIDEADRDSLVVTQFVSISPTANPSYSMTVSVLSYDRISGILTCDPVSGRVTGFGLFNSWVIRVSPPPAVGTYSTAETDAAIAAAVASAITGVVGGAPSDLNTLGKVAIALGNHADAYTLLVGMTAGKLSASANFSDLTDVSVARGNLGLDAHYVRFSAGQSMSNAQKQTVASNIGGVLVDAAQTLNSTQKAQVAANIGGLAATNLLALDSAVRLPKIDASAINHVARCPEGRLTPNADPLWTWAGPFTALRYVPFAGCNVPIYDSTYSGFRTRPFIGSDSDPFGLILTLGTNWPVGVYDLFVADVGSTVVLGTGPAWTEYRNYGFTPARAPSGALAFYRGLEVNAASMTLRYANTSTAVIPAGQATWVGTLFLSSNAGEGRIDPAKNDDPSHSAVCSLWNRHHQKSFATARGDPTPSWTVTGTGTWQAIESYTGYSDRIFFVSGLPGASFHAQYQQVIQPGIGGHILGIGWNNTTNPTGVFGYMGATTSTGSITAYIEDKANIGVHFVAAMLYASSDDLLSGSFGYSNLSMRWDC